MLSETFTAGNPQLSKPRMRAISHRARAANVTLSSHRCSLCVWTDVTSRIHTVKKCDTETVGKFLSSDDDISNHTPRKDTWIRAQWKYSANRGRGLRVNRVLFCLLQTTK